MTKTAEDEAAGWRAPGQTGESGSRSIIERHHGRVWAQPNDGPGATFSFSIPRSLVLLGQIAQVANGLLVT